MTENWTKFKAGKYSASIEEKTVPFEIGSVDIPSAHDPREDVLDAIYAIDPRTGRPRGDIAAYVSSKTSPEVKQFILDNIMIDASGAAAPAAPVGVDDDLVIELTRQGGESVSDYVSRMESLTRRESLVRQSVENRQAAAVSDGSQSA